MRRNPSYWGSRRARPTLPSAASTRASQPGLLAVGRAASAEGYAWDVLRVIPPAILTGQAAGAAAAQAIDEKCSVRDVNIPKLQKTLEAQNVLIHMTPDLLPKDGAEGHI